MDKINELHDLESKIVKGIARLTAQRYEPARSRLHTLEPAEIKDIHRKISIGIMEWVLEELEKDKI